MRRLSDVCEGILDVTADNFEMGLYDDGYRVSEVEANTTLPLA